MQPNEITEVLNRPISQELLARDLTRLAYVAKDGTPRNVPIGFTWNGSEIVMCTPTNAPKLPALRANPAVALTIDTEVHPPKILLIRGRAELDVVDGIPDEYIEGDHHLRDDARATGRVGGGGAFALPRRHGPDRRDPDLGQADRLRDDTAERGRGTHSAAGSTPAGSVRLVQLRLAQVGYTLAVLAPGQPNGLYHRESNQEDFLVLSGECLLLVEGEERPLKAWDFVHCPAGTEHIFVGAGDGPCLIFMAGARTNPRDTVYPRSELALRHGAGAERDTDAAKEAYAPFSLWKDGPPASWDGLPWALQ